MEYKGAASEGSQASNPRRLRLNISSSAFVPTGPVKSRSPVKTGKDVPLLAEIGVATHDLDKIIMHITNLKTKSLREESFRQLKTKMEDEPNLASLLWYTPGIIATMLQEIVVTYPLLSTNTLEPASIFRLIDVLELFQCIAQDSSTKFLFLKSHLHLYFYPLINTANKLKHYENLRVQSLAVIGALLKVDDYTEAISYLVKSELIVLCLRIMKKGSDMAKSVAIFIVRKILMNNIGLDYVCTTEERLQAVVEILRDMVNEIDRNKQETNLPLAKQILRCFVRLSENAKGNKILRKIVTNNFTLNNEIIELDKEAVIWRNQILSNLGFSSQLAR